MRKNAFLIVLFITLFAFSTALYAEVDPDFAEGLKNYNTKKYEKAIEHFKEYLKKKPDPAANYLIGYSLYKLKKFDEAEDFFNEAFLLDPDFSLEKVGLIHKVSEGQIQEVAKPSAEQTAPAQKQPEPKKETVKEAQPQKPEAAKVAPEKKAVKPEPQKAEPKKVEPRVVEPQKVEPPAFPSAPATPEVFPGPKVSPGAVVAMIAGFGMIIFVIGIAFYVYSSLCLYLIAKKLNVSAPWTAWIPIVQIWTFVACAGKPWWWVLILIFAVPVLGIVAAIAIPMAAASGGGVIGIIIGIVLVLLYLLVLVVLPIYLLMLIAENLGRNKWLFGLVQGICWYIFPPVSLVLFGILAFSKSEQPGGAGGSGFGGTTEDTTVIAEDKTEFTDDKTQLPE